MMFYNLLLMLLVIASCRVQAYPDIHVKKPKGTMSFSVVLVYNEKSEVLLLRRKGTSFGDGLYALPGGKIESGETALQAAEREAQEEIGITIGEAKLVHVVDRQGPETEFYIFVFQASSYKGNAINNEPDKCDHVAWFPLHKLPDNMIPAHRQALELSQKKILYSEHGWEGVNV